MLKLSWNFQKREREREREKSSTWAKKQNRKERDEWNRLEKFLLLLKMNVKCVLMSCALSAFTYVWLWYHSYNPSFALVQFLASTFITWTRILVTYVSMCMSWRNSEREREREKEKERVKMRNLTNVLSSISPFLLHFIK